MPLINDTFMLTSAVGRRLYEEYAKDLPIIDYHCHLSPEMIACDSRFDNAYALFLGGDHYKWRQMRTNGIDEAYITGDKPDHEKWRMWAKTLPFLIGNPLFHWTQLELKRYFGIDDILTEKNADEIYARINECLKSPEFSARSLIRRSNVKVICTTDDPLSDLGAHKVIRADKSFRTKVLPTFRPDKAVEIGKDGFSDYIEKTGARDFDGLCAFLSERIAYFAANGCRLADHGVEYVPYAEGDASLVFQKKMQGGVLTRNEEDIYKTAVMLHCAREYARHDLAMQLHMGALRNNNTRMFRALGADTGFDSVGDYCQAQSLSRFLDALDRDDLLPKTILYTLNPKDNYVLGTMIGNFQGTPAGKLQFGAGWWFNDQKDGMVAQMTALANLGMLSRFIGMLTDSRSFLSYPRHEYFRRIFCNLIGTWVEDGEYPDDRDLLRGIVTGVCLKNAEAYFGF